MDELGIEPLKNKTVGKVFKLIDEEIKQKEIVFTIKEMIKNDLYD